MIVSPERGARIDNGANESAFTRCSDVSVRCCHRGCIPVSRRIRRIRRGAQNLSTTATSGAAAALPPRGCESVSGLLTQGL